MRSRWGCIETTLVMHTSFVRKCCGVVNVLPCLFDIGSHRFACSVLSLSPEACFLAAISHCVYFLLATPITELCLVDDDDDGARKNHLVHVEVAVPTVRDTRSHRVSRHVQARNPDLKQPWRTQFCSDIIVGQLEAFKQGTSLESLPEFFKRT